jgi:tRNA threonylcarbamoyladenosine biosynthesis protein TsaB
MKGILAIETATEACSVALWREPELQQQHEITPRQHSQRLFGMLRELLADGRLQAHGVEAIAYGSGPSAVQGLAYASGLPAIPVSTLACQAQTAIRTELVREGDIILSTIDARINEIYCACYRVENGLPVALGPAQACAPSQLSLPESVTGVTAVGSGCEFLDESTQFVREAIDEAHSQLVPEARDLIPLALSAAKRGELQSARQVQPVYVRDEINWKKIAEQGKQE